MGPAVRLAPVARLTPLLALLLGLLLTVVVAGASRVDAAWPGLRGVKRVAIEVVFAPDHPQLAPEVVEKRLEDALLANPAAPKPDPRSAGYYLPWSGYYGVGTVRLAVERQMILPGSPPTAAIPAIVWQVDRHALGPWRRSREEIMALIDDLVATLIADMGGDGS